MMPLKVEVRSSPAIRGSSPRPEAVAVAPLTSCKNVGRKLMLPSRMAPVTKLSTDATEKTG